MLASFLPEELRKERALWALRALAEVQLIGEEYGPAMDLARLIPHLPSKLREEAWHEVLEAARKIEHECLRAEVLAELSHHLPVGQREQVQKEALSLIVGGADNDAYHDKILNILIPHLPASMLREILSAKHRIVDEYSLNEALVAISLHLPTGLREDALAKSLAAARKTEQRHSPLYRLATLIPHVPAKLQEKALREALKVSEEESTAFFGRKDPLFGLAPYLPEELREEEFKNKLTEALRNKREDKYDYALILEELAHHLPPSLLFEALTAARDMQDSYCRAKILAALIPHLPTKLKEEALQEAWAAAQRTVRSRNRVDILILLIPYLPPAGRAAVLKESLATAREIGDKRDRVETLSRLSPHLPERLRGRVLKEALATARKINRESCKEHALTKLVPFLAESSYTQEALTVAREIRHEGYRVEALSGLVPYLPQADRTVVLEEALEAAQKLRVTTTWPFDSPLATALASLAPYLAELPLTTLYSFWRETLHILTTCTRSDLLSNLRALAPVIVKLGGEEAIAKTFHAIKDVSRWWP